MTDQMPVRQLRLCVTATDYEEALRFYRDVLGLPERASYSSPDSSPGGRVTILDAGIATLELANPRYAGYIDEVEVGRRVAGPVRVALEVDDAPAVTSALEGAGAQVIAPPTQTPWNSLNARLAAPAGLQLTIFAQLGEEAERRARPAGPHAGRPPVRAHRPGWPGR
jgi:predicted enzyme related to lactoylglutathione lyase